VFPSEPLSFADAAVFETFVVPRYLRFFGDLIQEMVLAAPGARVAHLGCRTGYPDWELCRRIGEASAYGVDPSEFALELARNKVSAEGGAPIEYLQADTIPTPLPSGMFSHVVCLHPVVQPKYRGQLFAEMSRLLYLRGQALIAMPLRGSFQEIGDLLREYALKYDDGDFGRVVEEAMISRPTLESISDELELAGLEDVDVEVRQTILGFDSGRALIEDPVCRLLVMPEIRASLDDIDIQPALAYLKDAVDRYWSEAQFELTVNVGCASARRSG